MRTKAVVTLLVLLFAFGTAQAQGKLDYPSILTGLRSKPPRGTSKAQIIAFIIGEVKKRGVDKPLTADREDDLRQAGATNELITAIRANSPQVPKSIPEVQVKPTPQASLIDEKSFRPYRDPDGVFSINIYSSWKVQRQTSTLDGGLRSIQTVFAPADAEKAEVGGYLSSGMLIEVLLPAPGGSFNTQVLAAITNQMIEGILRQNKGFEMTSDGKTILDDMSAKVSRYQGKSPLVSESEKDIVYIFGNQKAVVVINLVEPDSKEKLLNITNERCAKSFALGSN